MYFEIFYLSSMLNVHFIKTENTHKKSLHGSRALTLEKNLLNLQSKLNTKSSEKR